MSADRAAYVAGLRQLAAFIETHLDLPLPCAGSHNAFVDTKPALVALARNGVRWAKDAHGDYFSLRAAFDGGHAYAVNISRDQVCHKVVTGMTRVEAQPARDVEEFHWECADSLLGGEV